MSTTIAELVYNPYLADPSPMAIPAARGCKPNPWDGGRVPSHLWSVSRAGRSEVTDSLLIEFSKRGLLRLPSRPERYESQERLLADIEAFIKRYVELPVYAVQISAAYVVLTWAADNFEVVPYLRFVGPPSSGKSRALSVLGAICYRATMLGASPTGAAIFRIVDKTRGTLLIDESDVSGAAANDLMSILRAGYQRGRPIPRQTGAQYSTELFDAFGPKVLAGTRNLPDSALESRIITLPMHSGAGGTMPTHLALAQFEREARHLRNQLLRFRFEQAGSIFPDETVQGECSGRVAQIIATLTPFNQSAKFRRQLIAFLTDATDEGLADSEEAAIVEALQAVAVNRASVPLPAVAAAARRILAGRNSHAMLTNKTVASNLRSIGLGVDRSHGQRVVRVNPVVLQSLAQRYGVLSPPSDLGPLPVQPVEAIPGH